MGYAYHIELHNRSGYNSDDLRHFFERGLRAMRVPRSKKLQVTVVASPVRSRGCAEVGGNRMVIAIASPSHFSIRRLARLFEHEVSHTLGMQHSEMPEKLLYSLGSTPDWAKVRIRYSKRAPNQLALLGDRRKQKRYKSWEYKS